MRAFYKYADLPTDKEIKQEWISNMDPRKTKRGRPKKHKSLC